MEIDVAEVFKYTLQYSSDSDSEVPNLFKKDDDVTSLWNKFLVPDQLDFLIQKSGMSPMLDASPNKEASTSPEYWSETKTFFQKDLAGLCVYMAPPAHNSTIKDYLSHYLAQKALHPELSGVFVLPQWLHVDWASMVEDKMELLHTYRPRTKLWTYPGSPGKTPRVSRSPWGVAVYVDRASPVLPPQRVAALDNNLLFNVRAHLSGSHARVL